MSDHPESNPLLLTNTRIILNSRIVAGGTVAVDRGRIVSISEGIPAYEGPRVDLKGATLFPGFVDVHIHGAAGVDTMDSTADGLTEAAAFLTTQGVTGWLPTLVPSGIQSYHSAVSAAEQLLSAQDASERNVSARILGVHYEGPFVNTIQCGALHVEHFQVYTNETQLDSLPALKNPNARMMMTFAPEVDGGVDLARALTGRGWVLSIGHTRANVEILDRALAAGAKHMTHFMNAMAPLHHRSPGPVSWGLMHDDITCDIIADGHHLDPYTLRLLMKLKGSSDLCLISDSIAAAGKGDGEYAIWGETITVKNGRTSNAKGSIAGSVITMLDAVRMMRSLDVSDVEVARMASLNPAKLLGMENEIGSIEVGKRADLVALDADGKVRLTIIDGKVAFRR